MERTLEFDLCSGELRVKDVFALCQNENREENVLENIVTQLKPLTEGNRVILTKDGVRGVLTVLDPAFSGFLIKEYEHSNHNGVSEKVYAIQWKVMGAESCFTMNKEETV